MISVFLRVCSTFTFLRLCMTFVCVYSILKFCEGMHEMNLIVYVFVSLIIT